MISKYKRLTGDKSVSPSAARAKTLVDPNNYPGHCWSFKGSSATIHFSLQKPVAVSHITVDHSHPSLRLCNDTAPRVFQVRLCFIDLTVLFMLMPQVTGLTPSNLAVQLFSGTFDFRKQFQTFDINNLKKEHFSAIQFQIISNYGGAFTCVYRIRIHAVWSIDYCLSCRFRWSSTSLIVFLDAFLIPVSVWYCVCKWIS